MFKTIIVLSAVFSLTLCLPFGQERVVNGTDAEEGEFPYIVSLRSKFSGSHSCGASIISPDWILTAAHCVDGRSSKDLNIQYGVTEISSNQKNVASIEKIVMHENYNNFLIINDVAVLKLADPLKFNEFIQPVGLPKQGLEIPARSLAVLVGWGRNDTYGPIQKHLQKVELVTFSDEECHELHHGQTYPTNICAGVPEGGKGQCNGDSGGPLTVHGTQVGIVSWSRKPCTIAPYPGVYTKVSKYIDWIEEKTGLNLN